MATPIYWNFVDGLSSGVEDFLSPAEQTRLGEMRFDRRRQSFLSGRKAVKQLLHIHPACAALPSSVITVCNDPGGAPFVIVEGREIPENISISHRENAAAAALSLTPGVTVGIDLEMVEEHTDAFVEDFFTMEEAAYIHTLPEQERTEWTACAWSAKEAVLKALKVGLRVDSRSVSIFPANGNSRQKDWLPLQVSGAVLDGVYCQVWWRVIHSFVLTLAVLETNIYKMEEDRFQLMQITGEDQQSVSQLCEIEVQP